MGRIDLGLTVITYDASSKRIDLDGDHQVLHLKVMSLGYFSGENVGKRTLVPFGCGSQSVGNI